MTYTPLGYTNISRGLSDPRRLRTKINRSATDEWIRQHVTVGTNIKSSACLSDNRIIRCWQTSRTHKHGPGRNSSISHWCEREREWERSKCVSSVNTAPAMGCSLLLDIYIIQQYRALCCDQRWRESQIFPGIIMDYQTTRAVTVSHTLDVFHKASLRGCIQTFPDWLPGARTANGTALCY
jgi:hypothetical protein